MKNKKVNREKKICKLKYIPHECHNVNGYLDCDESNDEKVNNNQEKCLAMFFCCCCGFCPQMKITLKIYYNGTSRHNFIKHNA